MIFGNAGGLGAAGPDALDFEGHKWERLFVGLPSRAREIMAVLGSNHIPNRSVLPPDLPEGCIAVEVMHIWIPQARELMAAEGS